MFGCIPSQQRVCKCASHTSDEQAYSKYAKMYQYCLHSTNHSRNYGPQNAIIHQLGSKRNGKLNRKNRAKQSDLESKEEENNYIYK